MKISKPWWEIVFLMPSCVHRRNCTSRNAAVFRKGVRFLRDKSKAVCIALRNYIWLTSCICISFDVSYVKLVQILVCNVKDIIYGNIGEVVVLLLLINKKRKVSYLRFWFFLIFLISLSNRSLEALDTYSIKLKNFTRRQHRFFITLDNLFDENLSN